MKSSKLILFFGLLMHNIGFCQNIDSLKTVVNKATSDTQRINLQLKHVNQFRKTNPDWAKEEVSEIKENAIAINYSRGIARSLEVLALINYRSEPDSAISNWKRSLVHWEKLEDTSSIANITYNIGLTYYNKGEFSQSLELLLKSLTLYQQLGDSSQIAKCFNPIGFIYLIQDDYTLADKYLSSALNIYLKQEDKIGQMRMYNNLGGLYQNTKEFDKALNCYKKCFKLSREVYGVNKCNDYETMMNIANTYKYLGQFDTAEVMLQTTVDSLENCDPNSLLFALNIYAEVLIETKKYTMALTNAKRCEKLLTNIVNTDQEKFVAKTISNAYSGIGDHKLALLYYKKHTAIKDSLFNESKSKEIGKLEAQYEMEKKQEEEKRIAESEKLKAESEKSRRDNLQFSGIFVFVLLLFAVVFMSGKFSMSEKVAEGLIFFTFLLFFEFCLVLLDPLIEQWSRGEPLFKLLFNAVLAAAIFPAHAFFENTLKRRILKQR